MKKVLIDRIKAEVKELEKTAKEYGHKEYTTAQALMNVFHIDWNKEENDFGTNEYITLVHAYKIAWPAAALVVLLGKYLYQVANGGHLQYLDNGYASGVLGFFRDDRDPMNFEAHLLMINLLRKSDLVNTEEGQRILSAAECMLGVECIGEEGCYEEVLDYCEGDSCEQCNGWGCYTEEWVDPLDGEYDSSVLEECDNILYPGSIDDGRLLKALEAFLVQKLN